MTASLSPRHGVRSVVRALLIAALIAVPVLASGPAAQAAPAGPSVPAAGVSKSVTAAEREVMARVSSEEVARLAEPLDLPTVVPTGTDRGSRTPQGPEQRIEGTLPQSGPAAGQAGAGPRVGADATQNGLWPYSYNSNPNRQVGKLYFDRQPGAGEVWGHCTATAVTSQNKSTLVTAGHCVYSPDPDQNGVVNGNGFWHENLRFCPGYEYGCKLGTWYYRQIATTSNWYYGYGAGRTYDFRDDTAIVVVSPNTSGYVVNVVGGQGITFNSATGQGRTALGYPAYDTRWPQFSYNGEDLIWCGGRDTYDTSIAGTMWLPCTMTGGASGGPWLVSADAQWLGYVNSVNSHKPYGGDYLSGPYFDSPESSLYNYWRNR